MERSPAPISEAAQRVRAGHMSRLLVTDQDKPVGVIAISDLVASIVKSAGASIKRDTVADVMSDAMLVCRDKTPLTSVARAMTSAHYRSVLVVDAAGKPLGVISSFDIVAEMAAPGSVWQSGRRKQFMLPAGETG